jgi:hypothetical protein
MPEYRNEGPHPAVLLGIEQERAKHNELEELAARVTSAELDEREREIREELAAARGDLPSMVTKPAPETDDPTGGWAANAGDNTETGTDNPELVPPPVPPPDPGDLTPEQTRRTAALRIAKDLLAGGGLFSRASLDPARSVGELTALAAWILDSDVGQ